MTYTLPQLPYDFSALEPVISGEIMELHYKKHHQGYVNQCNSVLEKIHEAESKKDLSAMVALQAALRFNAGGHINHSIFWTNLAPINQGGGEGPKGDLAKALEATFGSVETFKEKCTALATGVQGSGWGWLGYDPILKRLALAQCSNQDPLQAMHGLIPLLGIDVWEHAYYLQYKNVRPEYVKNIWKVIHWKNVEERFAQAIKA